MNAIELVKQAHEKINKLLEHPIEEEEEMFRDAQQLMSKEELTTPDNRKRGS